MLFIMSTAHTHSLTRTMIQNELDLVFLFLPFQFVNVIQKETSPMAYALFISSLVVLIRTQKNTPMASTLEIYTLHFLSAMKSKRIRAYIEYSSFIAFEQQRLVTLSMSFTISRIMKKPWTFCDLFATKLRPSSHKLFNGSSASMVFQVTDVSNYKTYAQLISDSFNRDLLKASYRDSWLLNIIKLRLSNACIS